MKNKGFTLVEIIAVITILGIILLFAIPKIGKMTVENDIEKYEKFMDVLNKSLHTYADMELGPNRNVTISIEDLEISKYLSDIPKMTNEEKKQSFIINKNNGVVNILIKESKVSFGSIKCNFDRCDKS